MQMETTTRALAKRLSVLQCDTRHLQNISKRFPWAPCQMDTSDKF